MKKLLYILTVALILVKQGDAQINLVPNPGFEDTTRCPYQINLFQNYVKNWAGVNCQYFNDSCDVPDLGVPNNLWGYQQPHSGMAMVGTTTIYLDSFASTQNQREYMYAHLSAPLTAGKNYFVSMFLNPSNNAMYACSNFGAYFSSAPLQLNHMIQSVTPQIQNDAMNNPLTDTSSWTQIKGRFAAAGGEQYITLGNFTPDSLCRIRYLRSSPGNQYDWRLSFYYLDDVLVTLDTTGVMGLPAHAPFAGKVNVFPNPSNGDMTFTYDLPASHGARLAIYDVFGKLVRSYPLDENKTSLLLHQGDLAGGIYLYHVLDTGNHSACTGRIVILK